MGLVGYRRLGIVDGDSYSRIRIRYHRTGRGVANLERTNGVIFPADSAPVVKRLESGKRRGGSRTYRFTKVSDPFEP